jgi:DNA-binding NarL/FixJ family response regulator
MNDGLYGAAAAPAIRIAVGEDAWLVREAIESLLRGVPGIEIVAMCGDGTELRAAIDEHVPDVVITDVRMPPGGDDEGIRLASELRSSRPAMAVLLLSQRTEPAYALELVEGGAERRGYLLKERLRDRSDLVRAIHEVAGGGTVLDPEVVALIVATRRADRSPLAGLTPRELEVLAEMAEGKSNAAIADQLVLTKRAVEKHVGSIFLKLDLEDEEMVSRRVSAVLVYLAGRRHAPDGADTTPGRVRAP